MNGVSVLTACSRDSYVEVLIPENVQGVRKRPGVAHFTIRQKGDNLPIYLYFGGNGSLESFRQSMTVCHARPEPVQLKRGTATVLGLEVADQGAKPNARIVRVRRQEFRVMLI